jgi:tetratricopeptide (TPR) repeat protein
MNDALSPAPAVVIKAKPASKPPYVPALGPFLRVLLWMIFGGVAILGATGAYLLVITTLNQLDPDHLYTTPFTFWMIIGHTVLGVVGMIPFILFGMWHLLTAYKRSNRAAVRLGILLFALGLIVGVSGLALIQLEGLPQLPTGSLSRNIVYFAHVLVPILAIWAYVAHRRAGPAIKWKYGKVWAGSVAAFIAVMGGMHFLDPRKIGQEGPKEGVQYFFPSEMRTATGNFIPERALMMDEYCMKCHEDVYNDHLHSAHKFSSFNNPAYLFSVIETRKVAMERDGKMNASRWCAGCHDIVPFASGKFDDPNYDIFNDPTAHAGITCVVCHSITSIHSTVGNAAYTIEEAAHYPGAFSDDPLMQWLNNQLIKAKPEFHKKTFLKPFHRTAEFCSTCHKVHLPVELNHYKDFLRGQNHYDTFVLSGAGHGSRSFYFPNHGASENCATCHMELIPSQDFGSKDFDGSGIRKRHSHFFPGSNTGLPELLKLEEKYKHRADKFDEWIQKEAAFLKDGKLRIDLFGVKSFSDDGTVDDDSLTLLRPELPKLVPGKTYLIEVVIRTLNIGHPFTQGTADSNEVWVDFHAKAGGRTIGRNGALENPDDSGPLDPWAHTLNAYVLDRHGNRIDRRNPQDIFTPLFDKQVPPGAGQVVHYKLTVPEDVTGPVELTVRLRFRKFDYKYMQYVYEKDRQKPVPKLPIVDICSDTVTLPVAGVAETVPPQESPIKPAWQRWNDYGIGCLLEGGPLNPKKGNLRQAEAAFQKLTTLGVPEAVWHGHLNTARVYIDQGRLREAKEQLNKARSADPPAPWWVLAWFTGLATALEATDAEQFDAAIKQFETIVDPTQQPRHPDGRLKYNFTRDTVVLAELGKTLYRRSQIEEDGSPAQHQFLARAIDAFERALAVDSEDLESHYGLSQCYAAIGRLEHGHEVSPGPVTGESLQSLAVPVVTTNVPKPERLAAAGRLMEDVAAFGRQPPDPKTPKLPPLRSLLHDLRAAYKIEPDPDVKAAVAGVLAEVHLALHAIYKPDELARSRTTAKHRAENPAANHKAEAIVIYPTNRPGAPGLEE